MPDQVGHFIPLYIWKNTRKRKNNKKEKNLTGGMGKLLDLMMFVRNLGENKEWTFLETTQGLTKDQSERIKGKSWCISRMRLRGWR